MGDRAELKAAAAPVPADKLETAGMTMVDQVAMAAMAPSPGDRMGSLVRLDSLDLVAPCQRWAAEVMAAELAVEEAPAVGKEALAGLAR